jgi:uncharacterized protein YceK
MSLSLELRRHLLAMTILVTAGLLSGCMLVAHHGHGNPGHEVSSHEHTTSAENEGVAVAHQQEVDAVLTHDDHDGMSMMHGSGGWHWLMGGAMVVMMVLVIL